MYRDSEIPHYTPPEEKKKVPPPPEKERLSRMLGEMKTITASQEELAEMERRRRRSLAELKTEFAEKEEITVEAEEATPLLEIQERPEKLGEVKEILSSADRLTSELYDLLLAGAESLEEKQEVLRDINAIFELRESKIEDSEVFDPSRSGANNSHILSFVERDREFAGIYKPRSGEANRPGCKGLLPGIEAGTYFGRAWLAFMIDRSLGSKFVLPTVLRRGSEGPGSVQEWASGARSLREAAKLPEKVEAKEEIVGLAAEHYVEAQADGKPADVGVEDGKLIGFDNGGIFSRGFKYLERGELRDFAGGVTYSEIIEAAKKISPEVQKKVLKDKYQSFLEAPQRQEVLKKAFETVLGDGAKEAWNIFITRTQELAEEGRLPADYDVVDAYGKLSYGLGLEREGKVEMAEVKIDEEREAA